MVRCRAVPRFWEWSLIMLFLVWAIHMECENHYVLSYVPLSSRSCSQSGGGGGLRYIPKYYQSQSLCSRFFTTPLYPSSSSVIVPQAIQQQLESEAYTKKEEALSDMNVSNNLVSDNTKHKEEESKNAEAFYTIDEVKKVASLCGIDVQLKTLGPFYSIDARLMEVTSHNDKGKTTTQPSSEMFGTSKGFIVPWPGSFVHLDSLQINRKMWDNLDAQQRFPWGASILLGAIALRHAYDKGKLIFIFSFNSVYINIHISIVVVLCMFFLCVYNVCNSISYFLLIFELF